MTPDGLVSELDARYPKQWDLWRAGLGHWCLKLSADDTVFSAVTLADVLQQATAHRLLPAVPRCPALLGMDRFTYKKEGSYWALYYDGQHWAGHLPTKKRCVEVAAGFVDNALLRMGEWYLSYGPLVYAGVEGENYRYKEG